MRYFLDYFNATGALAGPLNGTRDPLPNLERPAPAPSDAAADLEHAALVPGVRGGQAQAGPAARVSAR